MVPACRIIEILRLKTGGWRALAKKEGDSYGKPQRHNQCFRSKAIFHLDTMVATRQKSCYEVV